MDARNELAGRRQAWIDVLVAGDADGYAELVAEDVVWIPPHGRGPIEGRAEFRAWVAPIMERWTYRFELSDIRLRVTEDWAVERGRFHTRMRPKSGGEAMEHGGRYLLLWRRGGDGTWRMDRYVDLTALDADAAPGEERSESGGPGDHGG